ncbi:hypothetical protein D3C71_1509330 [compost metagenome]
MWKPASPIAITGRTLTVQEAWWYEFMDEIYDLCNGAVDGDWLTAICHALYPFALDDDPRLMARLAYAELVLKKLELADSARRGRIH